ncbi:hypothetical protein FAZ69_01700 [Trinickia terrae]|uniref:Uncharacterized protein n=1 Tax=Trinickia terrae TaxID=2571161 RepID=A0A4U1IFD3_9BURK|nr:hypothetical protein FAZ69_01700 [Trinickia terrae]
MARGRGRPFATKHNGWTPLAGALGIMFGYRGVILALLAALFVFVGFNVVNIMLIMDGMKNVFGVDPTLVAVAAAAAGAVSMA